MKHFTKKVVVKREVVESHVTCDSCGLVIPEAEHRGACMYSDEITVKRHKTEAWPGDAWGQTWDIDCCLSCWETKVLPLFQNVNPREW